MQKLVWQNSNGDVIDLTSGNYNITNWEGFSNTDLNIQSQQVPFQDGGVFLDALIEQRELSVTLAMQDNGNLEERYRLRRELIHILNPKLGEGYLIYTNDFISKRIKCIAQIPLFETHNSNDSGTPKASLTWTACEPYWEDLEETEVEIIHAIPININNTGDVKTQITASVIGNCVNPIIRNQTEKNFIKVNYNVENQITIDTQIGNKRITVKETAYRWVSGGYISSCASNGDITIYTGTQYFIKDENGIFHSYIPLNGMGAVYYIFNKFYCNASDGIYTSLDGITWDKVYNKHGIFKRFGNVLYLLNSGNAIDYTSDGENWSSISIPQNSYIDFSYSNNIYTLITVNKIITSIDNGSTFIERTNPIDDRDLSCVASGNNKIIIFTDQILGDITKVATSIDGETFSVYQDLEILRPVHFANFINGRFYCCSNNIFYGDSELDFQRANIHSDYFSELHYICFHNNYYESVGESGEIINSVDSLNWEVERIVPFGTRRDYADSIVFFKNKYISCSSTYLYKSNNLINWEQLNIGNVFGSNLKIENGYCVYILKSYNDSIAYSRDGNNWTIIPRQVVESSRVYFNDIIYDNIKKRYIITGSLSTNYVWSCENLEDLQNINNLTVVYQPDFSASTICVDNSRIIIAGRKNGCFAYLSRYLNGSYWSEEVTSFQISNYPMRKLVYGNNAYVLIIENENTIYFSEDLQNWGQKIISNMAGDCIFEEDTFTVTSNYEEFEASAKAYIYKSTDGKNWEQIDTKNYGLLRSICYNGENYIMVGSVIIESYLAELTNIISSIEAGSDMNLGLKVGNNKLYFNYLSGNAKLKLSYRQKYIGV